MCASRIPTRLEEDMDSRTQERVTVMNGLLRILAEESSNSVLALAPTQGQRDQAAQESRSIELFLASLDCQLKSIQAPVSATEEGVMEVDTKRSILGIMKADHKSKLINSKRDADKKAEELQQLEASIVQKQRQLGALNEEVAKLQSGSRPSSMTPWPLTYPKPSGSLLNETNLVITQCSLCLGGFPDFDVVVASCKHLYHPWCSVVVFSKGNTCVDVSCTGVGNANWRKSFGWVLGNEEIAHQQTSLREESPMPDEGQPSDCKGKGLAHSGMFLSF